MLCSFHLEDFFWLNTWTALMAVSCHYWTLSLPYTSHVWSTSEVNVLELMEIANTLNIWDRFIGRNYKILFYWELLLLTTGRAALSCLAGCGGFCFCFVCLYSEWGTIHPANTPHCSRPAKDIRVQTLECAPHPQTAAKPQQFVHWFGQIRNLCYRDL